MSSYDAGNAAHDIIDQETSSQSSPIYGKELVVVGVSKGADPRPAADLTSSTGMRPHSTRWMQWRTR